MGYTMEQHKAKVWRQLQMHQKKMRTVRLTHLFQKNPRRAKQFSLTCAGLLLDYSKNFITTKTIHLLTQLAEQSALTEKIEALFQGKLRNHTDDQIVLH